MNALILSCRSTNVFSISVLLHDNNFLPLTADKNQQNRLDLMDPDSPSSIRRSVY